MDTKDKFITHEQTKAVTGSLANLQTTQKGNLVAAINDVLENGGAKDADELTFDATKATHTSGSTGEALSKVVPSNTGTEGQVITLDENGKPIWKTPQMGGIELVNVHLATEDSLGTVSGLEVAVSVEGETEERFYTTDASGNCQFKVSHGLQYTVSFPTIEGYHEIADLVVRASLTVRNISETYQVDTTVTQEHVKVTLSYVGGDGTTRATSVQVQIGTETSSHAVVNNIAEFDIPLGSTYEIKYVNIDSYATPPSHTYLAELHTRNVRVTYIGAVDGLSWVKYDGSTVAFEDVTAAMKSEIVGLRIANSILIEGRSTFIVPLEYLLGEKVIGNRAWCAKNVLFQQIDVVTSQAMGLQPAYTDGEGNTLAVVDEAAKGSQTVTAGTAVPAFAACQAIKYTVNGIEKSCFLGSFAQMKAFSDNRTNINKVCNERFSSACIIVNSGNWWTSTQCSETSAVLLDNGSWYTNFTKTFSDRSVVPFLAS